MKMVKRILRYIKGTINHGLTFTTSGDLNLIGYSDSDWGGDVDDRKSTIGYVFFMGDIAFTWCSKKQSIMSLSTCEVEYVAATSSVCHTIWLRKLPKMLRMPQQVPTTIHVDNKSAVALAKNPIFYKRSKHIDTRFHFIRDYIEKKEVKLAYVRTNDQVANIFMKPLKFEDFARLRA